MVKRLLVILGILGVLVVLGFGLKSLNIKNVTFKIDSAPCVSLNDLKKQIQLEGKNILSVNSSEINQTITNKYKCVSFVNLQKKFPNSVILTVVGRKPALVLNYIPLDFTPETEATPSSQSAFLAAAQSVDSASSSGQYLIDKDGYIYSKESIPVNLTQINYLAQRINLGDNLGKDFVSNLLTIFQKLKELAVIPDRIPVLRQNYLLVHSNYPPILLFSLNKDINVELASLQLILQASKMNQDQIDMLDLRFDKPVVKYSKEKR